jgi:hypothetical protein
MAETLKFPSVGCSDVLTEMLRAGAQRGIMRLSDSELIQDVTAGIQAENGVKKNAP